MPLPHYNRLLMTGAPGGPGTLPHEAVYLNLFEISFILPLMLQAQGRDTVMLLQQATSVTLDLTKEIPKDTQRFKYTERAFLKSPESSIVDFVIKFNLNVNEKSEMYVYNTLRAWYDLAWNSQNGTIMYKSDKIGTIIVNQHDFKGVVLRRVVFQNCQMMSITGTDLDFSSNEIQKNITAKFVADYWIDEYIDNNFTISPPLISGY